MIIYLAKLLCIVYHFKDIFVNENKKLVDFNCKQLYNIHNKLLAFPFTNAEGLFYLFEKINENGDINCYE